MATENARKKRRTPNTSPEQIEEYLPSMESDSVFRSNTLNPTVPPDYIKKKWDTLAMRLNSCDSGPQLSVAEWIRRFKDWKNATRAKARRNVGSIHRTGGGPSEEIKLSPVEERGLAVWGKVVITRSQHVPVGGLQQPIKAPCVERKEASHEVQPELETVLDPDNQCSIAVLLSPAQKRNLTPTFEEMPCPQTSASTTSFIGVLPKKFRKSALKGTSEARSTKAIGEEFLCEYKKNKNHSDLELKLNIAKFKFEVAKYSHENPGFFFDVSDL